MALLDHRKHEERLVNRHHVLAWRQLHQPVDEASSRERGENPGVGLDVRGRDDAAGFVGPLLVGIGDIVFDEGPVLLNELSQWERRGGGKGVR